MTYLKKLAQTIEKETLTEPVTFCKKDSLYVSTIGKFTITDNETKKQIAISFTDKQGKVHEIPFNQSYYSAFQPCSLYASINNSKIHPGRLNISRFIPEKAR